MHSRPLQLYYKTTDTTGLKQRIEMQYEYDIKNMNMFILYKSCKFQCLSALQLTVATINKALKLTSCEKLPLGEDIAASESKILGDISDSGVLSSSNSKSLVRLAVRKG
jgi:hypothetical protein